MNVETLAMFGLPGGMEWIVILVVALLIFGRRLPDVARSVGKSIVEFKKGIRDVESDVDTQAKIESSDGVKLDSKPAETDQTSSTSGSTSGSGSSTSTESAT